MSFKSLGLSDALLKAISKKGYETPSVIQQKAIPLILEQKDVLASAQTGSGKTAGFALPILQILNNEPPLRRRPVRALILTPTRELAAQVQDEFKEYSEFTDLRSTVIFGGVGANPQINALRNGVDILVATPGRLLDLENQGALSLSKVEILVLDEADRMLDMGFLRDIKKVLALLPSKRQNLLFSATFSKEIKKLANEFLHHPVLVEATPENTTVEKIHQTVYRVDKAQKTDLIIKLISEGNWQQVLVFTRTKHGANRLSEKLEKAKITSAAIHGNKSQGARTRALSGFKEGKVRVLVATDIAARGLDIPLLPHVINFELPNISEDYVHRIGRTGRAGASGEALSLVSLDEVGYLKDIEKLIGERLQPKILSDFQPTETMAEVKAAEAEKKKEKARRQSRGRNSGDRGGTSSKGQAKRGGGRR
ncbi:DEAD/DEAH box helicase [Aequorivita viscosa]|uniref:DEAD-box ATP-dependent RNA helicase RhpA n=1 Tax=Aequorivita viscosa TaxID=797419 RepID=A0A1M6G0C1_9FLAO|nr:DEAD/DEAH box helicase [Aequorivita viscosa]SDW70980.1 ATP-dependent RNA helicase RhlE [Aequorivita viscosa]SHJ03411.1 ATP-dependent RNA helicase RhlE [Aequorivita viscosa]